MNRKNKRTIIQRIKKTPYGTIEIVPKHFDFELEKSIIEVLKKMQFVETVEYGWTMRFVRVVLSQDGVFIGHKLGLNDTTSMVKMTKVSNPLRTIKDWINHFDKI